MKIKTAIALTVAIGLVITTLNIPVGCSNPSNDPEPEEEFYFEDINILVVGRCRDIGWVRNWNMRWLHIGFFDAFDVVIGTTWLEKANIIVYNKSLFDSYISLSGLTKTYVLVWNATGIFYYSGWMGNCGLIPWKVFFNCHADRLWIRYPGWEP